MTEYFNQQALVDTDWVAKHATDAHVRLVEVSYNSQEFNDGHIPGTVAGWVFTDIIRSDIPNQTRMSMILSEAGISNQNTIVLYGGLSNIPASFFFWLLKYYGHDDVRLLDGGRQKWLAENRPLTKERATHQLTRYTIWSPNEQFRANKSFILSALKKENHLLVDSRSQEMYEKGRIPTAVNIPAQQVLNTIGNFETWHPPTTNSDGTFKSAEELRALFAEKGITPDKNIVAYCIVGGLSSHMWFSLTQLLGYPHVREYDRSWEEWSSDQKTPIEK